MALFEGGGDRLPRTAGIWKAFSVRPVIPEEVGRDGEVTAMSSRAGRVRAQPGCEQEQLGK